MTDNTKNENYFIKASYKGHFSDIRIVKAMGDGFLTGSRDNLVKFWTRDDNQGYEESHIFIGATHYVSSICVLPPTSDFPNGVVVVGCHDCLILGFTLESEEPIFRHRGHSGPVSALCSGPGFFVSGSWDKTARVWSNVKSYTLTGHSEAVWAVEIYPPDLILTASADCTIRVWNSFSSGEIYCERTLYGHSEAVRGLVVTPEKNILSCSNDGSVREWDINGQVLNIFFCADNYLYSIALLDNGLGFAVCSEDCEVCIWENGSSSQVLKFEGKTIWGIAALENGDMAVGSSDGTVYVIANSENSTSESIASVEKERKMSPNKYFPVQSHIEYTNGNHDGMQNKILEFNELVPENLRISTADVSDLMLLTTFPDIVPEKRLENLDKILLWDSKFLLPVLDLMRFAVRSDGVQKHACHDDFMLFLIHILRTDKSHIKVTLACKIICNMFGLKPAEATLAKFQIKICEIIKDCLYKFDDSAHKSISNVFLNYAIAAFHGMEIDIVAFCNNIYESINAVSDSTSLYRMILAIGTICVTSERAFLLLEDLDTFEFINNTPKFHATENLMDVLPFLKV